MKYFFYNHPVFRILWPTAYGSVIYLLILLLNNNLSQLNDSFFGQELYFCIILAYVSFESVRLVINYFLKKQNDEPGTLAALNMVFISLLITAFLVALGVNIYFRIVLGFNSVTTFSTELAMFLAVYLFSVLFYISLIISTSYLYRKNRSQINEEQILKENLELELMKFKNEINPDLLYDSLESLIPIIHENAEKAEDYIDKMALVYRYILSSRTSELVSIEQEMKAVNNVIVLLNEKFNHNIQLQDQVEPGFLERLVIPGAISNIIQSIVMNTIISHYQPLQIQIEVSEDDYLVVSHALNDKLRPTQDDSSIRLQQAYSVYTERPIVSVKAYGENFIKIPLLQLEEELA